MLNFGASGLGTFARTETRSGSEFNHLLCVERAAPFRTSWAMLILSRNFDTECQVTSKREPRRRGLSPSKLAEMIEEATVDAYGESEQTVGFFTMLEERLKLPFKTAVLGAEVTVVQLDMTDDEQIVAVCSRGKARQRVPILDLPLPEPPPEGAEWIEAFGRWVRGS